MLEELMLEELTLEEMDLVSGAFGRFVIGYLGGKIIDATIGHFHQDNGGPSAADWAASSGYIG
jgi:hypothetical protein